jgi:hypothetical protein
LPSTSGRSGSIGPAGGRGQRDAAHRERAAREGHARAERHDVAERVVERQLIEEEQRDAGEHHRDRDAIDTCHALAHEPRAEQRDPDGCRILDQNCVGRGRQLVGENE